MTKLKSWHLDRRTFLRGAGGLALGLPFLEAMQGQATVTDAAELPKRVACFFFPNGVALPPANSEFHSDCTGFLKEQELITRSTNQRSHSNDIDPK